MCKLVGDWLRMRCRCHGTSTRARAFIGLSRVRSWTGRVESFRGMGRMALRAASLTDARRQITGRRGRARALWPARPLATRLPAAKPGTVTFQAWHRRMLLGPQVERPRRRMRRARARTWVSTLRARLGMATPARASGTLAEAGSVALRLLECRWRRQRAANARLARRVWLHWKTQRAQHLSPKPLSPAVTMCKLCGEESEPRQARRRRRKAARDPKKA